jgi:predicted RNA methylase
MPTRPRRPARRPAARPARAARPAAAPTRRFELVFLPGLAGVVEDEVRERLGPAARLSPVPGRDDAFTLVDGGPWRRLNGLRTVVAAFAQLHFDVPRPRSLTSGEYLPRIVQAMAAARALDPDAFTGFRFDAAGARSAGIQALAAQLEQATGLAKDPEDGDMVLRLRRAGEGWDVLVRLSARPLSARAWRVRDFPGAANATVAAAMTRLTGPQPGDRVLNLLCGSGTLLIERLLAGSSAAAVAVDNDPAALGVCAANLAAAGLNGRAELVEDDLNRDGWTGRGPFDLILADPPWGDLLGHHTGNEQLHLDLLTRAHEAAAPGARLAVLTHEVRRMERCLGRTGHLWRQVSVTRVFHKGHHPRIYVLERVAGG